ncbi:hypothetical protein [Streptomyces sp. NBC_01243]|uniref:hypothetical protein n=1 Tax=unclassified Streptomyces TaxID=2593676 RepID=UPI002E130DA3|nr:hypothetical protein OG348_42460 [Streptomyces sp. NBC_01243]
MTGNRLTEEHVAILRKSGILNTDTTLNQLLEAGVELEKLNPNGAEPAAATLIGPWYAYHTLEQEQVEQ